MAINVKRNSLAKQIAKRRWLRRLPWFDLPARAFIETDNARLFVDLGDWHGPSYHLLNWGLASYEPDNLRFLEQCLALNPEGVFFDVGANIGIFAFQLARKFPGLTVHAFEPDQTNVDCLNETFARNAFPHVNVHQLALSEKKGEAIFYADEDNHGGHSLNVNSILDEGNRVHHKITVLTDTLDGFMRDHAVDRLDVIKLDVQRHEGELLSGAHETIDRCRPIVLMECYFKELCESDSKLLRPFLEKDYAVIEPSSHRRHEMTTEALKSLDDGKRSFCDLAFIPEEKFRPLAKL